MSEHTGLAEVQAPATAALPARRGLVLAAIQRSVRERGYPPTLREIAREVGLSVYSVSTVTYHLRLLQEAGLIAVTPGTPRGIRLLAGGEG